MAYEKTNWTSTTPITTTNLNNMENGIEQNNKKFDYSTEEQIIGTWINKKPIYRIVLDFSTSSSKTDNYLTIDTSGLKIDKLINAYGSATMSGGSQIILLSDTQAIFLTSSGRLDIYFNNSSTADTYSGYITIEYTKTTD